MPALYNLAKDKLLSDNFAIVAADRTPKPAEAFRDYLAEGVRSFVSDTASGDDTEPFDAKTWDLIASRITHFAGDFTTPDTYSKLCGPAQKDRGGIHRPAAMSCSTSPSPSNCSARSSSVSAPPDLAEEKNGSWRRVIIEKPFGHDLAFAPRRSTPASSRCWTSRRSFASTISSARRRSRTSWRCGFRTAIFEPLWNRDHIDHVQITAAETVGVERRANFYEVTGALRDMVPNHVFQLLSLTAMESPNSFAADAVRSEKTKVLEAVQPLDDEAVRRNVIRGQYAAGSMNGSAVQAYRQEPGVKPDSMTETYVALRLGIENWRWAGVPFYLRTGKRLTRRTTEIAIHFKQPPFALFRDTPVEILTPNVLILQIQPDEGVALQFGGKIPGPRIELGRVRMDFRYSDYFHTEPSTGYETLVYDCMIGEAILFNRADGVEAGWEVVQPILDLWAEDKTVPLEFYPSGSAGPDGAENLLWRSGRQWRPLTP